MDKVALDYTRLNPGDRLISTNLASAYHHVGVYPAHWKYLGFEFEGVQYVYCVLPFGLSASAGTFCRFTAVVAKVLRASGLTSALIVYIDDFGCALGPAASPADALEVITIIESFGFSVREPKTNLLMLMVMDLLGFTLDTNALTCASSASPLVAEGAGKAIPWPFSRA